MRCGKESIMEDTKEQTTTSADFIAQIRAIIGEMCEPDNPISKELREDEIRSGFGEFK